MKKHQATVSDSLILFIFIVINSFVYLWLYQYCHRRILIAIAGTVLFILVEYIFYLWIKKIFKRCPEPHKVHILRY